MYIFRVCNVVRMKILVIVCVGSSWTTQSIFCSSVLALKMKQQGNGVSRVRKGNNVNARVEGSNWLLIAAGALLSTLSIRLGYKLKQALDSKPKQNASTLQKGCNTQKVPVICTA